MLKSWIVRARQGHRTVPYPEPLPSLPGRFRGLPVLDSSRCGPECDAGAGACPTGALSRGPDGIRLDLGRCLFCAECESGCPHGAVRFTNDPRTAARRREELLLDGREMQLAGALDATSRRLFGRSLKLRQVSAGGCNGCEVEVNVLNTVVFDLGRFGIQFVASPRHADGLLVTGPVSRNMDLALRKTWEAVPEPRLVIAVGACAISGGPYAGLPEQCNGVAGLIPVDLFVPGCPPHPLGILDGLLRMLGRIEEGPRRPPACP
jgi:Ni,Fe-hydrogenase III small subunit/formate hydrogenlyase subunit 6/NADH:ubiquinone oxidoreductase subunit I